MDHIHQNLFSIVMAMRRAGSSYVYVTYNLYGKYIATDKPRASWYDNAVLLETTLDEAIEPVTMLRYDFGHTVKNPKPIIQSLCSFTESVKLLCSQTKSQLMHEMISLLGTGGGGAFHITATGHGFMDFDPRQDGLPLQKIWEHDLKLPPLSSIK